MQKADVVDIQDLNNMSVDNLINYIERYFGHEFFTSFDMEPGFIREMLSGEGATEFKKSLLSTLLPEKIKSSYPKKPNSTTTNPITDRRIIMKQTPDILPTTKRKRGRPRKNVTCHISIHNTNHKSIATKNCQFRSSLPRSSSSSSSAAATSSTKLYKKNKLKLKQCSVVLSRLKLCSVSFAHNLKDFVLLSSHQNEIDNHVNSKFKKVNNPFEPFDDEKLDIKYENYTKCDFCHITLYSETRRKRHLNICSENPKNKNRKRTIISPTTINSFAGSSVKNKQELRNISPHNYDHNNINSSNSLDDISETGTDFEMKIKQEFSDEDPTEDNSEGSLNQVKTEDVVREDANNSTKNDDLLQLDFTNLPNAVARDVRQIAMEESLSFEEVEQLISELIAEGIEIKEEQEDKDEENIILGT